jgi:hypothetical protein
MITGGDEVTLRPMPLEQWVVTGEVRQRMKPFVG